MSTAFAITVVRQTLLIAMPFVQVRVLSLSIWCDGVFWGEGGVILLNSRDSNQSSSMFSHKMILNVISLKWLILLCPYSLLRLICLLGWLVGVLMNYDLFSCCYCCCRRFFFIIVVVCNKMLIWFFFFYL